MFVKGVGAVSFARFNEPYPRNEGAIMHIQTRSVRGQRVDICLFGSMDNVRGFRPYDDFSCGWTSSAEGAIGELLRSRGTQNTSQWDDEQSRSVEALKIALCQGVTGTDADHAGKPETRGFTIGDASDCEFFADVYTDVVLDPGRWSLDGELAGAERIIVGRPLWIRSMRAEAVVRYAEVRKRRWRAGWRSQRSKSNTS